MGTFTEYLRASICVKHINILFLNNCDTQSLVGNVNVVFSTKLYNLYLSINQCLKHCTESIKDSITESCMLDGLGEGHYTKNAVLL